MQKIVLFSSFLLCLTGMASIVAGESPSSSGSSFSPVSLTLTGKNPKKTRGKAGFFLAKDENGADFYVCVTSQVITYKTETSEWKELPGQTSLNISDQADSSNWQQLEVIQNRVQAAHAGDSLRERQASPSIAQFWQPLALLNPQQNL